MDETSKTTVLFVYSAILAVLLTLLRIPINFTDYYFSQPVAFMVKGVFYVAFWSYIFYGMIPRVIKLMEYDK